MCSVLLQRMKSHIVDLRDPALRSRVWVSVPVEQQLLQSRPCVLKMLVHRGASAPGIASRTATVRRGTGDAPPGFTADWLGRSLVEPTEELRCAQANKREVRG